MINWWLPVLATIISIGILALSLYLVILFISPEDKSGSYLPKIIIILSLSLCFISVLMLPFDVASRIDKTTSAYLLLDNINTSLMWEIILWLLFLFSVIVVPFTYFYYDSFDPDNKKTCYQLPPAFGFTFLFLIFILLIVGLLWFFVGDSDINYKSYQISLQKVIFTDDNNIIYNNNNNITDSKLIIKVSFFVYMVGIMCFLGWVLFLLFGGIGLFAFPIDQIIKFIRRPKKISAMEFSREMEVIAEKAKGLLLTAQIISNKTIRGNININNNNNNNNIKPSIKRQINIIRNETYLLENHLDLVIYCYEKAGGSPFVIFGNLLSGIIGLIISILWILHIFIYTAANVHPFLNTALIKLDEVFSLLGVLFYGLFSFYLLLCVIKGQVKFGMRFVFFSIHPLKVGDTMINSLLFNIGLLLISTVAVIQFCANSFNIYSNNTSIGALLNLYVGNLKGLGIVIYYIQYIFITVSLLSIIWLVMCARQGSRGSIFPYMGK